MVVQGKGDESYLRPRIPASEGSQGRDRRDEVAEVQTTKHRQFLYPHRKTSAAGTEDACSSCRAALMTVPGVMPVRHSWPMGQTRL
jgi:LSD1 subclass zinc finger protein